MLKELLEPSNMIIIITNIIFYMIIQTLFFYFVASKQFNNLLTNKMDIVNEYLSFDEKANNAMKKFLKSQYITDIKKQSKQQENKCNKENKIMITKYLIVPFIILIVCLCVFVYMLIKKRKQWIEADTILMILIISVYSVDLIFYFTVIKKYKFIGDENLYYTFYSKFKQCIVNEFNKLS